MKKAFEPTHNPIADAPVDPPPEQPNDAELLRAATEALAREGRLSGETFTVAVEHGCATLTGSISDEFQRTLVDACLSAVPGILVVRNQLDVRESGPMAHVEE